MTFEQLPNGRLALTMLRGRIALLIHPKALMLSLALLVPIFIIAVLAMVSGTYEIKLNVLLGLLQGLDDPRAEMVLFEWRLPRIMCAIVFGAALGIAGAIFQTLTRNPLGSPDIIGLDAGAYFGALIAIIIFNGQGALVSIGAISGGLFAASLVYLFSWKYGVQHFRLIIVGIGVGALLTASNNFLLMHANLDVAMRAAFWGAGTLGHVANLNNQFSLMALFGLMFLVAMYSRSLRIIELGDSTALAFGLNVERAKVLWLLLGVSLSATVTAITGPIGFVALSAPHIARTILRDHSAPLMNSAMVGALLLLGADFVAQHAFSPSQLPVGVVTISVGGLYLLWLLVFAGRDSR